jgi:hypothetical protein
MTVHAEFGHDAQAVCDALATPEFLVDRSLSLGEVCANDELGYLRDFLDY